MSREDDASAAGPERQSDQAHDSGFAVPRDDAAPAGPDAVSAVDFGPLDDYGNDTGAAPGTSGPSVDVPAQRPAVLPGQRTAYHPRGPFPEAGGQQPPGAGAAGPWTSDAAAAGTVPAQGDALHRSRLHDRAVPGDDTHTAGASDGTGADGHPAFAAAPAQHPDDQHPDEQHPGEQLRDDPLREGPGPDPEVPPDNLPAGPADPDGPDGPADAVLADRARDGDRDAENLLLRRHHDPLLRYARLCARPPHSPEDLLQETHERTIRAIRSGHGPREAVRPYMLQTMRRVAGDLSRKDKRLLLTDDIASYEHGPADGDPPDPAVAREERNLALQAFRDLPERWQAVIWYAKVEQEPPSRIAPLLGITANTVSKLTERAVEGLREAYLTAYAGDAPDECRPFTRRFSKRLRGRMSDRRSDALQEHLDVCDRCRAAYLSVADVNSLIRELATGVLGALALAYLGAAAAAAATVAAAAAVTGATGAAAGAAGASGSASGTGGAAGGSAGHAAGGAAGRGAVRHASHAKHTVAKGAAAAAALATIAAIAWAMTGDHSHPKPPMPVAAPPLPVPVVTPPPVVPPVSVAPTPPAPPRPAPPVIKPVPKPPAVRPVPSHKPLPTPKPTPTLVVSPSHFVYDNGRQRVECNGAQGYGKGYCSHVTVTLPRDGVWPTGGIAHKLPAATCTALPARGGKGQTTLCFR